MVDTRQTINVYYFVKIANYFRVFRSFCLDTLDCVINKERMIRMLELETMPTQTQSYLNYRR
jgi:hypothetical protein